MAPRWVKKRDGRIQPYDEARIAGGVLRAGRRAGSSEEVERLAREMATTVTIYMTKSGERAPATEAIATCLEDALEGSGHGQIARMVRDWRDWRRRRLAEIRYRDDGGGDPGVEVLSLRAARPWTKRRIVKALQAEAELDLESAEDVARAVEERVFAAGLNQISSNLLRELIDAELFERGFSAQLGKLEVLGVPRPELERLAFLGQGKAPRTLEDRVSRTALERYALDEIVAGQGADAHRRRVIHLVGLGRPFRLASGAVCARAVCEGADSPLDAVRRLLRVARGSLVNYDLMFGLVDPAAALASFAEADGLKGALELFLDALYTPYPDDVPPAPEVVLVVPKVPQEPAEASVLELLLDLLIARGADMAGLRLIVHVSEGGPGVERLLQRVIEGARAGAGMDLVVGPGTGLCSRGMIPWLGTVQLGLINLPRLALSAGRGERDRFSRGLRSAVEHMLEAFHKRRRRVFASVVGSTFPLFASEGAVASQHGQQPDALADALGVVGLDAALRYLTGESIADNPRVAELALELYAELRREIDRVAARLGLGEVLIEDVPPGDAGIGLAAADLDRFPDAKELLGGGAGWDTGAHLNPSGDRPDPYADLEVRCWLARKTQLPLVLSRPVLAQTQDPDGLTQVLLKAAGTTRVRRRPEAVG